MDSVTIRLRKVMRNPLLGRRQAVVECIHPNKANVSKKDAAAKIAKMLKVSDLTCFPSAVGTVVYAKIDISIFVPTL